MGVLVAGHPLKCEASDPKSQTLGLLLLGFGTAPFVAVEPEEVLNCATLEAKTADQLEDVAFFRISYGFPIWFSYGCPIDFLWMASSTCRTMLPDPSLRGDVPEDLRPFHDPKHWLPSTSLTATYHLGFRSFVRSAGSIHKHHLLC